MNNSRINEGEEEQNLSLQSSAKTVSATSKSKNYKIAIVCLSILTVISITAAAIFAVFYFSNQNSQSPISVDKPISEPTNISTEDTNSGSSVPTPDEVAKLLKDKYEVDEKRYLCYGAYYIICGMDNFDKDKKLQFTIANTPEELLGNKRDMQNAYIQNIKYDDLNSIFNKYFGSSENIDKEDHDFDGFLIKMEYLPDSDSFDITFKDGLGGTTPEVFTSKVVETHKTETGFSAILISIIINNVVMTDDEPTLGFFGDKQVYETGLPEEYVNDLKNSLSAYEFNFIDENGEYKLTSIKKLNS